MEMQDERGGIDIIYLDFWKTFDSVPHQRQLKKAQSHGLGGDLLKRTESFLVGRKQMVSINCGISSWADVRSGIPKAAY